MKNPSPENRRIFEGARDHLNDASIKNSEQFDKAILSLSSAGLALSLSFTKFVKPISEAEHLWLLHSSWLCFGLAIIATVISFLTSNSAITVERDHIYKYYIEENDVYGDKKNYWGVVTFWLNRFSAIVFLVAVMSTVFYVWSNTQKEESAMSQEESTERGYVPPKKEPASESGSGNNKNQGSQSQPSNDKK
jgi:hypothetical protein